jgi:tetratricopeptide (TPR) repeat protein
MARRSLLPAAAVLAGIAGCASNRAAPADAQRGAGPVAGKAKEPEAITALVKAADREEQHPVAAAMAAPPPEGVEPKLGELIPESDAKAHLGLDEAIAQNVGERPAAPAAEQATEDAKSAALHHYVVGREKLLSGDAAGAANEFRSATELDPTAGEPWRELGEAQLAQGHRTEAMASFKAAVANGLEHPRPLELLGRTALERGDFEEALRMLGRASLAQPEKADPALSRLILIELSRALVPQGYIVAAKQAIERALTSPAQLSSTTRYSVELGSIFRRQGELWRDVGDANCRLGKYGEAIEAYRRASELPTIDNKPVSPRIVFACMRAGRPSAAAAAILEGLEHDRLGEDDIALLKYITQHGGDVRVISDAISSLRAGLPTYPSIDRDLVLARAAILPPAEARSVLRSHLQRYPSDVPAATRYLDTATNAQGAAADGAQLVAAHPESARAVAESLLRSRHEPAEVLELLKKTSPRGSATLIAAYITAKQGNNAAALAIASGISHGDTVAAAAAAAVVETSLDAGNLDAVDGAMRRLRDSRSPEAPGLLIRCQILTQRHRQALETVKPLLAGQGLDVEQRINTLLSAADIANALGMADEAETWVTEAHALDPSDDRPSSMLMVLYSVGGLRPDSSKLTQVVRELRQSNPDSRTLRLVRAREMMRRSQGTQAETELRQLIDSGPDDAAPMEMLASTWAERFKDDPAAAEPVRQWLTGHLKRRPHSPVLLGGMVMLDCACGHAADGEKFLRDALAGGAGPDVSRILERLLREQLSRPTEADAMARARLEGHVRSVTECIELADLETRSKHQAEAIKILRASIPPDIDPTRDQAGAVIAILAKCIPVVMDGGNMAGLSDASRLCERLITFRPEMTPELQHRRLEALASVPETTAAQLFEAARQCRRQFPETKAGAYVVPVNTLIKCGRRDITADFVALAADDLPGDADLYDQWFIAVARFGTTADARVVIDAMDKAGKLKALVERLNRDQEPARIRDYRAEAAYILGNEFSGIHKAEDADAAYELALEYDPKHAWASNNLGYALADRGVDLDRASRLLEQAYEQLPTEAPVLDSLAWLRYKQGVILDVIDPKSGLTKPRGALSLLRNAASTQRGRADAIIQDHFGDALWLAGKKQEAMQAWQTAAAIGEQQLQQTRLEAEAVDQAQQAQREANPDRDVPPRTQSLAEVETRRVVDAAKQKRFAAASGKPVQVAPQLSDPNPQPIKQADKQPTEPN